MKKMRANQCRGKGQRAGVSAQVSSWPSSPRPTKTLVCRVAASAPTVGASPRVFSRGSAGLASVPNVPLCRSHFGATTFRSDFVRSESFRCTDFPLAATAFVRIRFVREIDVQRVSSVKFPDGPVSPNFYYYHFFSGDPIPDFIE